MESLTVRLSLSRYGALVVLRFCLSVVEGESTLDLDTLSKAQLGTEVALNVNFQFYHFLYGTMRIAL